MHMRRGDGALKPGNEFPGLRGTGFRKSTEVKIIPPVLLQKVNLPDNVNRLVIK